MTRLRELRPEALAARLEISTVDGFQGREKEAIIISMVGGRRDPQRSNLPAATRLTRAAASCARHSPQHALPPLGCTSKNAQRCAHQFPCSARQPGHHATPPALVAACAVQVRSNASRSVGFLSDARRMNVAVTRARRHCALVCDSETVPAADPFLARLLGYFEENGEYASAGEYATSGAG